MRVCWWFASPQGSEGLCVTHCLTGLKCVDCFCFLWHCHALHNLETAALHRLKKSWLKTAEPKLAVACDVVGSFDAGFFNLVALAGQQPLQCVPRWPSVVQSPLSQVQRYSALRRFGNTCSHRRIPLSITRHVADRVHSLPGPLCYKLPGKKGLHLVYACGRILWNVGWQLAVDQELFRPFPGSPLGIGKLALCPRVPCSWIGKVEALALPQWHHVRLAWGPFAGQGQCGEWRLDGFTYSASSHVHFRKLLPKALAQQSYMQGQLAGVLPWFDVLTFQCWF